MKEKPEDPVEQQIRGYIYDICALSQEYLQKIKEYLKLLNDFLNLKACEREGSKTRVILILSQYGTKEDLEKSVDEHFERTKNFSRKLNQLQEIINGIILDGSLQCVDCKGTGRITKMKYLREGGVVTPFFDSSECPMCKGVGKVRLSEAQKNYLTMATRLVGVINELGTNFLNTLTGLISR
jgi:hypothetical protein